MAVNPLNINSAITPGVTEAGGGGKVGGRELPFADMVQNLIKDTNQQQANVDQSLHQLVNGEADSIHDVVLAASRADLAFRLVLEIRNKLVSSYQEIMRMQV